MSLFRRSDANDGFPTGPLRQFISGRSSERLHPWSVRAKRLADGSLNRSLFDLPMTAIPSR